MYNLSHPVSGNRQFALEPNGSGGYIFYTRGTDRIVDELFGSFRDFGNWVNQEILNNGYDPLDQGSKPWRALQKEIKKFINAEGGSSQVDEDFNYRPKFEDIEPFLDGLIGIDDLQNPCKE